MSGLLARAIAVRGVGYAAAVLAVNGLKAIAAPQTSQVAGGAARWANMRPRRLPSASPAPYVEPVDDVDEEALFIFTATRQ